MYHYQECGLPNVYLSNGYTEHATDWGAGIAIADVAGLHRTIGLSLVAERSHLSGADVRFIRKELGLSQTALGNAMGCEEQTVSLWERQGRIPAPADRLLRALYVEHVEGSVAVAKMLENLRRNDHANAREKMTLQRTRKWKVAA
jgi:putative transcriptional regulator